MDVSAVAAEPTVLVLSRADDDQELWRAVGRFLAGNRSDAAFERRAAIEV